MACSFFTDSFDFELLPNFINKIIFNNFGWNGDREGDGDEFSRSWSGMGMKCCRDGRGRGDVYGYGREWG